jgi:ATP-binding cassette subfamily F protein 2
MSSRNKNSKKKQQTKSTVVPKADNAAQLLQALEDGVDKMKISPRTATGVLTSQEKNRDIKVEGFSLSLFGTVLIEDTKLELNWGRRYGLLGLNGTGKSTMLKVLGEREVPLPEFMSVHLLESEVVGSDLTALEAVIEDAANECKRLEALAEELTVSEDAESDKLQFVYDCIDELEVDKIVPRAAEILHGLGFTKKMQQKKTKDFSGGWRMRIALAKALFIKPMMLLLDEPTNHLDLEACVA